MAGLSLSLRLVCALAPATVGGIRFFPGQVRRYGIALVGLDDTDADQRRALFADPTVDVSVGVHDPGSGLGGFVPVIDELDLQAVVQRFADLTAPVEPAQLDTDALRIEAEIGRDTAGPEGDEPPQNTATAPDAGEERPASEGPSANASADPGDGAAPPPATGEGEVSADLAATAPAGAEGNQPAADQAPAPVVATETEPAAPAQPRPRRRKS